jgi:hypothetical protein
MILDGSGNVYICDSANHCIRKVDVGGNVSVFAGQLGSSGTADGTGTAARFNNPSAIAMDSSGNLFVADTGNSSIRKITSAGVVTTFAGTSGQSGSADGTGSAARFSGPEGIVIDVTSNNIFVADTVNNTIRKITSDGVVTTFSGVAGQVGDSNGGPGATRFNHPTGLTLDSVATVIIADTYNHAIRGVTTAAHTVRAVANGTITAAGKGKAVITDPGLAGSPITVTFDVAVDDTASAWAAKAAAALAANGTITARYTPVASGTTISLIYVVPDDGTEANLGLFNDTSVGIIDAPTSTGSPGAGSSFTVAGTVGVSGAYDGRGEYALFNLPRGLSTSASGVIYIADSGNNAIRRVSSGGVVSTVAGIPGAAGRRNGGGEQALFNQPQGVLAVGGNAVVADTGNSVLRLVSIISAGSGDSLVSTIALKTSSSNDGGSSGGGSSGGGSSGGGGGGAPSTWFIAALGILSLMRWLTGRKAA